MNFVSAGYKKQIRRASDLDIGSLRVVLDFDGIGAID
jgi:hypothetical protein